MKTLFTTLLLLMLSISGFAQTEFLPLGAEWYYKDAGWGLSENIFSYKCIQVDTVEGRAIKIIEHTRRGQTTTQTPSGLAYSDRYSTHLGIDSVYEENDTVFIYNEIFQRYTPLYVFNVQEGDTFSIPVTSLDVAIVYATAFDSTLSFIVDSIRTVDYGGVPLETFFISPYDSGYHWNDDLAGYVTPYKPRANWIYHMDPANRVYIDTNGVSTGHFKYNYKGAYTRLFGGVGHGLKPQAELAPTPSVSSLEGHFFVDTITCYTDNNVHFNRSDIDCDAFRYNTPLSLKNKHKASGLFVLPNPGRGKGNVTAEQPIPSNSRLSITNMMGRVVWQQAIPDRVQTVSFDIGKEASGMYLIRLQTDNGMYALKYLLVNE